MSRVLLEQVRSLALYKGELTKARRLPPIQQLKCVGKACELFQPDVVKCYNNGGSWTDIDWTCEADLPEKLRFGRVDVSCEGWCYPGDPYVLKGSCGLEYRLINTSENQSSLRWFENISWNEWLKRGFLWSIVLLAIYIFFGSYIWNLFRWLRRSMDFGPSGSSSSGPRNDRFTWSHGGNSGRRPAPDRPLPPHSEYLKSSYSNSNSASTSSGPTSSFTFRPAASADRQPSTSTTTNDRGEGPSNLGHMRRSTGYGVTNVR